MAQKRPKARELRTISTEELRDQVQALRQELWETRLKARSGAATAPSHEIRQARRQLARVLTISRERTT